MIKLAVCDKVRFSDSRTFPLPKLLRFFSAVCVCSYIPGENYIVLKIECYPIKNILLSFIIDP